MGKNKNKLNKNGNSSEPLLNDLVAHGRTFSGNYQGESIKRLKLTDCIFDGAKLNDVAATGSNFCRCIFENCDMDQGDFEYCDFFKCDIKAKHAFRLLLIIAISLKQKYMTWSFIPALFLILL